MIITRPYLNKVSTKASKHRKKMIHQICLQMEKRKDERKTPLQLSNIIVLGYY